MYLDKPPSILTAPVACPSCPIHNPYPVRSRMLHPQCIYIQVNASKANATPSLEEERLRVNKLLVSREKGTNMEIKGVKEKQ
jgi:hypothetical protein